MMNVISDFSELSIVIPTYNEVSGLFITLADVKENLPGAEVIVVDDHSVDGTRERLRDLEDDQLKVVYHGINKGYGAAIKTGMKKANRKYIAWFDADNEHRATDLKVMFSEIKKGVHVAVIGERSSKASDKVRVFGKFLIKQLIHLLGVKIGADINCGLRIFAREAILPNLSLLPDNYSASLTSTMILIERNYQFTWFPISLNQRQGKSKVKLSDGFSTLALVLRVTMLFAPLRIFFRFGGVLFGIGLAYGLLIALTTLRGFPVASVLLSLSGVMFILLGLIADQISQLRLHQLTEFDMQNSRMDQYDE